MQAAPDTHFIKYDGRFLSEWLKVAFVGTFNYASHLNIAVKTEEDGFQSQFLSISILLYHHPQGVGLVISKLCHAK